MYSFVQPPPPIIAVAARTRYVELSWLGVGVLTCLLYSLLYYVSWKFLSLRVLFGWSLFHFLITLLAIFGLGQVHYMGVSAGQNPTSYNPGLEFLGVHAFSLLLFAGLSFLIIVMISVAI